MSTSEGGRAKGEEGVPYKADVPSFEVRERVERFEDLRVWQAGMDLAVAAYELAARLPDDERYGLTSQIKRSATSVPSNIAEGWGRGSRSDYLRFLRIARGSLYETKTQLLIAGRVYAESEEAARPLIRDCEIVRRQLQALISSLERQG